MTSSICEEDGKISVYGVKVPDESSYSRTIGSFSGSVKSNNRTRTKFQKPASKADMDNLLVTTAKSIITHLRKAREQAALKDKEDDEESLFLQSHSKTKETA